LSLTCWHLPPTALLRATQILQKDSKLLHEYEGELHKEEIDYITNFTFTESYFYGLPKVHKSEVVRCDINYP
jgi:hypothetical protein